MNRVFVMNRGKTVVSDTVDGTRRGVTEEGMCLIRGTADAIQSQNFQPQGVVVSAEYSDQRCVGVFLDRLGIESNLPAVIMENLVSLDEMDRVVDGISDFDPEMVLDYYRSEAYRDLLVKEENNLIVQMQDALNELTTIKGVSGDILMVFGPWITTCAAMACDLGNRQNYRMNQVSDAEGFLISRRGNPRIVGPTGVALPKTIRY